MAVGACKTAFTPSTGGQIPLGTPTRNQGIRSNAGAFFRYGRQPVARPNGTRQGSLSHAGGLVRLAGRHGYAASSSMRAVLACPRPPSVTPAAQPATASFPVRMPPVGLSGFSLQRLLLPDRYPGAGGRARGKRARLSGPEGHAGARGPGRSGRPSSHPLPRPAALYFSVAGGPSCACNSRSPSRCAVAAVRIATGILYHICNCREKYCI